LYLSLGAAGTGILLHRTTERTGFIIDLTGRVLGDRDPQELLVSINNQAPSERNDDLDGDKFVIRLRVSHDRVVAAAGRLIIKIADPAHEPGQSSVEFGFAGYRIRPDPGEAQAEE